MDLNQTLPMLLGLAWLLPLVSFALIVLFGPRMGKAGHCAGYLATLAIIAAFILSASALVLWVMHNPFTAAAHEPIAGDWYALGVFGSLRVTIGYYIDALTIAMFCMVTLVASCIHVYSYGYMHEELQDVTDALVTLSNGQPLFRRGRFCRFFQYLSLFCFSMLGLVIAGNLAMVFVFWELVGICSYLLIGFYHERKSASNAGNKAFIVNRVGDFGMLIGLAAVWAGLGTFSFSDYKVTDAAGKVQTMPGIFSQVRPESKQYALQVPDGMVKLAAQREIAKIVLNVRKQAVNKLLISRDGKTGIKEQGAIDVSIEWGIDRWRRQGYGYWLLVIAGLGIFCGCVGKSAQFPLHVWLPDAMEGPTPVSALIHAATMVAAGVYLVGRCYPVFTPEVLLVIALIGCITLFLAATMALTATDIKRVLAYSTVSQLGYMMFALGVGGWLGGVFHLFSHAFFKSLLFLCSGSGIHACGTNEMPQMGGLLKKMPYTAWTMLIGCLAISGAGVPTIIGLSGYYSKDYIIAQALVFKTANPMFSGLFYVAVAGAGMTAFYMFRLWYMTFAGKPRDEHVYEHAHESPRTMTVPLVVLAVLSIVAGWNLFNTNLGLEPLLRQAIPAGVAESHAAGSILPRVTIPAEHLFLSHKEKEEVHFTATMIAFAMSSIGFILATAFYGVQSLDPNDARRTFAPIYNLFYHKWWFDELYQFLFVRPVLLLSNWVALCDKNGIDWVADNLARAVAACARLDNWIDRIFVDRLIDLAAGGIYAGGIRLRRIQTGNIRQYIMLLALGLVVLFVAMNIYQNYSVLRR